MAIIETSNVITDVAGLGNVLFNAGAPTNGTTEIQTITIGGTPTGGTFTLVYDGLTTSPITWSATNATLVSNIQTALLALSNIGASGVAAAVGTMTAGVGTINLTFGGNLIGQALNLITVGANNMTGTSPTVAVTRTTAGINATGRGAHTGARLVDTTNGKEYIQTNTTPPGITWTVVGTQS